ncbi:MAG: hypothetical protein KJ941_12680 [Bacteroidetes bacterium]|nr:hypothetical protein [Bacteroidota bacterium]
MHLFKTTLLIGFLVTISSCTKEIICPKTNAESTHEAMIAEPNDNSRQSIIIVTPNPNQGGGTTTPGGGGITDPNSDEDQNRKKKTKD